MPRYSIRRLKDHLRHNFRFAPHVGGVTSVKPRDYVLPGDETVEAASPYAAFFAMRDAKTPLEVGDLLETDSGALHIFKYVGFEEAKWTLPEPLKAEAAAAGVESTPSAIQL